MSLGIFLWFLFFACLNDFLILKVVGIGTAIFIIFLLVCPKDKLEKMITRSNRMSRRRKH